MDHRPPLGAQGPHSPRRAVSGGSYGLYPQAVRRPPALSHLSNVRSASQPANVIDLTSDGSRGEKGNGAAFLENKEKVVSSPDVINLEDEDGRPPSKRAKISGDGSRAEGDFVAGDRTDKALEVTPGSPLPSLPKAKPASKRAAGPRRHRFGIDAAPRKAHGLDPPAIATRVPPPKKAVDFSPWTGNSPEDQLNENVIKTGFFDRVQGTNQQESNSAKATIWPNLSQKNHPGLGLLSHVFTAVLDKRQVIGKCTAPSTFKPPPRVTVTDTKREAWLRDLANPEVPLRKQSRTIPHGIRGKVLMDQCLSKAIPLQRAVWLAKCVGANELRSFRRKGVSGSAAASGESKWVREWTVSVEQFLEAVVTTCGQQEWQQKISYAVKLAAAFYSEKLLDIDHYLDWIVSSLAVAPLERLPIWIILTQIYWKEITMYGRRGRKLAGSILEHLHCVTESNLDVNAALKTRLQKLVAVLAVSNRGCLIIPRVWEKYKYLMAPKTNSVTEHTPAANIAKRNERLAGPLNKTGANTRSALLDLYTELDAVGLDLNIGELASRSYGLVPDIFELVTGFLDWASTPYRVGIKRTYLVASIIARLHNEGHETDAAILHYLGDKLPISICSADNVHRVVVELLRLHAFSVGRYLQWLITSGVLSRSEEYSCATGLIAAVPTTDLPPHVLNTRKTLMRRLGLPVDETPLIDRTLAVVDDAVSRSATKYVGPMELPTDLTTSARFNISQRICVKSGAMAKDFGLHLGSFGVVREVIEHVGDIASLAELVVAATATDDCAVLATVADTVNLYADSFAAIGEVRRMVDALSDQYLLLRTQQPPDRTFILALSGLAQRTSDKAALVKLLSDDLAISEQQTSLMVCSPASDSLVGMHATNLDSDDDIDAVFASGNTMDDQLMQRVFVRIMQRAAKPQPPGTEPVSRVSGWLNQLRSVDQSGVFDRLVHSYVRNMLKGSGADTFYPRAISVLVSSGCLSLGTVADMSKEVQSPQVAVTMLPTFLSTATASPELHDAERYRYRLQQDRCQTEHADAVITLVRCACETPDFALGDPELIEFFKSCVQDRPGSIRRIFEGAEYTNTLSFNVGHTVMTILEDDRVANGETRDLDIRALVSMANPLSVRYCVGALRYFKATPSFSSDDEDVLGDAVLQSFIDRSEVWPRLLEFSGEGVNRTIHEWAQKQLLGMASNMTPPEHEGADDNVSRCRDLLAVTSKTSNKSDNTVMVTTIIDKLKDVERQLSKVDGFEAESHEQLACVLHQLQILLHLCVLHVHDAPDDSDVSQQSKYNLLATLCTLLTHPKLQTHSALIEYLFDVASTLSDSLPDTSPVLAKLQSTMKTPLNSRLISIFGTSSSGVDSWLALASQVHPPGSQQQRALNKHASQQQQVGGRPVQTPQQQHQRWPSSGGSAFSRPDSRMPVEVKTTPFQLRRWEIMPDPTPVMGENDSSLSLALFGARKV